ncbi:hypothetical protein ACVCEA_07550 [Escherichia coli]
MAVPLGWSALLAGFTIALLTPPNWSIDLDLVNFFNQRTCCTRAYMAYFHHREAGV